jgi:translocation and assembly module TamB
MQEQTTSNHYPRLIGRILLKTLLFIVLFVILVLILLFTPPVQKFLTGKVQNYLSNKLETKVEIKRIAFGLSGNLHLKEIYVEDRQKDTLLYGELISANVALLKLFSNEVQVKDIELHNVYANIKRILPDTAFNFQFITDAFITEQPKDADTAKTAPLKLNVNNLTLDNVRFRYNDVITGSDMFGRVGNLSVAIVNFDPITSDYNLSSIIGRNITADIKQNKPLLESIAADKQTADPINFQLGTLDLSRVALRFDNDVSSFYSTYSIGRIKAEGRNLDLNNNIIDLEHLELTNANTVIRLGRSEGARVAEANIKKELEEQQQKGWTFRAASVEINNNNIKFDNENQPRTKYGMDYAHLDAKALNLHTENLVISEDSIGGRISKGSFREKDFILEELRGDLLYAYNQSYLKGLYLKTPGSVIRRDAILDYASFDELLNNFDRTVMNVEIVNSRLQVKDILTFAPQLRSNQAFRNPDAIWDLDLVGTGTLNHLKLEVVKFNGLRNTVIDASGTLTNIMNPDMAGGNFNIRRLSTSQTDIALFTGQRLSTAEINLPETFNINGTLRGNAGQLNTNLNINSSAGSLTVNGDFSGLSDPERIRYNARVKTSGLALGRILRQEPMMGSVTGNFVFNGSGLTPNSIATQFTGDISSLGYNRYRYNNISITGNLKGQTFVANLDVNDPNADLDIRASGSFGTNTAFRVEGMIDSIKTLPLNFTTDPLVFRGRINGDVTNLNPDYLDADILITDALFVSAEERLVLDTVQLVSGHTDSSSFIHLRSALATASIEGQYRFSELGTIIQSSIEPYFSVSTARTTPRLQPYNFRFSADVTYHPVLSTFIPGLVSMEPLHAEGSFVSGQGVNGTLTTSQLSLNGNEVSGLNVQILTTENGLELRGNAGHLKSGTIDVYNTRLNATARNNIIDFNLGIDDAASTNKYYLSGLIRQPSQGTYAISLRPDSLLLNYDLWTVPQENQIIIGSTNISASNFVLQRGNQKLSIQTIAGTGRNPLQVSFTDFQLATITGFMRADTLVADGRINGQVTFQDLAQQPAFTSSLTISDLNFQRDTLGDLNLVVNTDAGNRYNTNLKLTGRENDVVMTGYFTPAGNTLDLNLDLDIRQLNLNTVEGATNKALSNASGSINGQVRIRGNTASPVVRGDVNFNNASFAMNVLGSQFFIDKESLSVTENGLRFNSFTIRDSANNRLDINGDILTSDFTSYKFGFTVSANNFLILNSTRQKDRIYFGRLNISSDLRVSGTDVNPVVDGNITVNDGTNLTIVVPQEEPGVVQREGVVEFVNFTSPEMDTLFRGYDTLNVSGILGMDIAANIEILKEAILNVIVDEANGDFLNVQGEAVISAGIDPSGKITLVGNYTLNEGGYEISFDLLRRKFAIERGSTITWTGEPTAAELNINAKYIANTPPLDLVQDQIAASTPAIRNTYLQRLPFEVRLNLTGELLRPTIDFDIVLPDNRNYGVSNDIVTLVQARLSQLRQDEGSINKQVFALLLLGRFVGENPLESSGGNFDVGNYARQSVSKLLTAQLNQLAAGLVGGVEIDFDVASTEDYTTGERRNRTDLNLGLSKRLLNDRLRVTVGSNFQLEGPQNSNQRDNNIAGNVALDYQLSKDGRYMLRYFRRNQYEGVIDGYIIENGLSFILSVDYNRFSEILKRKRQRVTRTGTTAERTENQEAPANE